MRTSRPRRNTAEVTGFVIETATKAGTSYGHGGRATRSNALYVVKHDGVVVGFIQHERSGYRSAGQWQLVDLAWQAGLEGLPGAHVRGDAKTLQGAKAMVGRFLDPTFDRKPSKNPVKGAAAREQAFESRLERAESDIRENFWEGKREASAEDRERFDPDTMVGYEYFIYAVEGAFVDTLAERRPANVMSDTEREWLVKRVGRWVVAEQKRIKREKKLAAKRARLT